ncbi:uncharacterized protein LOC114356230 [Ostrinia furnacalis]|uniref:uncharacterized protein LOC114356230 n=1 Tax=Ostrinia furnacalis TaxID=93504 RepID=UPI0010402FB7|nr:uncharacterized protein LOC114356230 [Ostrinia furnacalis]
MAWGYWSASSVLPDRGRSPRRAGTSQVHVPPNPPTAREVMESHDESIIHTASTSRDSRDHSASPHSSSNGGHSHHHEVRHAVPASALFGESYGELSRRPSLDLGSVRSALASCSGMGTLSAGSTLTRGGTLADYLPPTPCPHHHRVYVDHHKHYEQPIQPPHAGALPPHSRGHSSRHTDDEDDLEPTYATGSGSSRRYTEHHKHYEQPIQRHRHTDDEDDMEPTYATGKCKVEWSKR